jgi:CheY-like chemotaxis protein
MAEVFCQHGLSDYDMPGMNGAELASHMRQIRSELPIVLLSALATAGHLDRRDSNLFDVVVRKPVSAENLIDAAALAFSRADERR